MSERRTSLQEWIHYFEEGEGVRWLRVFSIGIILFAIAVAYNLREYQHPAAPDAMDAAQVARNLAEGRGFTTLYVRPVTIGLLRGHRADRDPLVQAPAGTNRTAAVHPDLANPPLYPLLLAGLMKVAPFDWEIPRGRAETWWRHQPDFLIALLNQALFMVAVLQSFCITRRLIHRGAAWCVLLILFGSDLFWKFSVSGLSTVFLTCLVLALVQVLLALEARARAPEPPPTSWFAARAALAAALVGAAFLTRYSAGLLLLPVLVFFLCHFPGRRAVLVFFAVAAFAAVATPWLVRNHQVSGTLLGVSGFAIASGTESFPGMTVERQFDPDLNRLDEVQVARKLFTGLKDVLGQQLPTLGGTWLVAFFFVGLFVQFVHPGLRRLRVFTLLALLLLIPAQCLFRTHLWTLTPVINSENLLAPLVPLVTIFGVALFFTLLDNMTLPHPLLRWPVAALFVLVSVAPLVVTFLPPRTFPVAYPPYYPPFVTRVASFFGEEDLLMTDQPWAMAWYGRRQAAPLTLDPEDEFRALHTEVKIVKGLYLTYLTLDQRFTSEWVLRERPWGQFLVACLVQGKVPPGFPLRQSPARFLPEHFLLADRIRWQPTGDAP